MRNHLKLDIKKIFLSFVVFFILILLFLVFSKKQDEPEYNQIYSGKSENIAKTLIIEKTKPITPIKTTEDITNPERKKYDLIIQDLREKIRKKNKQDYNGKVQLTSATNINYIYNPNEIENNLNKSNKSFNLSEIIFSKIFKDKNLLFDVEFNKSISNIRGRYYNNTIKLFDVENTLEEEFLSVFIHELGHYFDVKYLEKQVFFDLSDKFYDISWENIKILKSGSDKSDFISGYAMTNKYEDFAESFNYYVLFNNDFREKASKNEKLQNKYDFFSKYIFRNDEFKKTNFRIEEKNLDYYWDTTKIKFSVKKFLEYLKNGV